MWPGHGVTGVANEPQVPEAFTSAAACVPASEAPSSAATYPGGPAGRGMEPGPWRCSLHWLPEVVGAVAFAGPAARRHLTKPIGSAYTASLRRWATEAAAAASAAVNF